MGIQPEDTGSLAVRLSLERHQNAAVQ